MKWSEGIFRFVVMYQLVILCSCGAAHIKPVVQSVGLYDYENVYIRDVKVYSNEPSIKTNIKLQAKIEDWAVFTRNELQAYVRESPYKLAHSSQTDLAKTLILDIDVNITYGNKALRWAVGFGAGKGGVDSLLTATDGQTGRVKFKVTAESDLAMGVFGGDMDDVVKENVTKLIDQYRKSRKR